MKIKIGPNHCLYITLKANALRAYVFAPFNFTRKFINKKSKYVWPKIDFFQNYLENCILLFNA